MTPRPDLRRLADGVAYLIADVTTPTAHYWSGEGWTLDPNTACRFTRRVDAVGALAYIERRGSTYRVEEHMWPDPSIDALLTALERLAAGVRDIDDFVSRLSHTTEQKMLANKLAAIVPLAEAVGRGEMP